MCLICLQVSDSTTNNAVKKAELLMKLSHLQMFTVVCSDVSSVTLLFVVDINTLCLSVIGCFPYRRRVRLRRLRVKSEIQFDIRGPKYV
jgi:hypothetical protein